MVLVKSERLIPTTPTHPTTPASPSLFTTAAASRQPSTSTISPSAQTILPPPEPHHITLKFKHHKTTLLLTLDSLTSFTQIKSLLLASLRNTASLTSLNGVPLEEVEAEEIEFAVPVDEGDIEGQGWVALEVPVDEEGDGVVKTEGRSGRGRGRGRKSRGSVAAGAVMNENPLGAGLKEGGCVAFRFKGRGGGEEIGEEEEGGERGWDVVIPAYEDEDEEGEGEEGMSE